MESLANAPRATLSRRLAAWGYDCLIGLAVYMLAGMVLFALFTGLVNLGVVDAGGREHVIDVLRTSPFWDALFELAKVVAVAGLFTWSWQKKGQTLGMRAWKLRVQSPNGKVLTRQQAWVRALLSFGGLATFTLLWDDEKRSLQDRISGSEVVSLTLEQNRSLMNAD